MGPIAWIKNNLIIILLVICGVQFVFGGIGTLWYRHLYLNAQRDVQVAQANLATCKAVNDSWTASNEVQTKAILANKKISDDMKESADRITAAAAAISGPIRTAAQSLRDFKPSAAAVTDCDKAREAVDAFYGKKVKP